MPSCYQYNLPDELYATVSIQSWSRQLDPSTSNKNDWTLAYSHRGELTGVVEKTASNIETRRAAWNYDLKYCG